MMKRIRQYLREVAQELGKVSWPNRKETLTLTALVIGVTVVVAAYIGGLDYVFQRLIALVLNK